MQNITICIVQERKKPPFMMRKSQRGATFALSTSQIIVSSLILSTLYHFPCDALNWLFSLLNQSPLKCF